MCTDNKECRHETAKESLERNIAEGNRKPIDPVTNGTLGVSVEREIEIGDELLKILQAEDDNRKATGTFRATEVVKNSFAIPKTMGEALLVGMLVQTNIDLVEQHASRNPLDELLEGLLSGK